MRENARDLFWIFVMAVSLTILFIACAAIGGAR